jgi:acetyl-CoA acetyltransferase
MGRGKPGGSLSSLHPEDLLAQLLAALVARSQLDPGAVDDVLVGCVGQAGEQSATPGRMAWLAAGFPAHVPSVTIERKCGSGQQAVDFAVQGIMAGAYDIVIAAGVESMSRVPMGSPRMVADKFGLARDELDAYSAQSHARAARASGKGGFDAEIVPVLRPDGVLVSSDETIRPNTTVGRLAGLKPVFGTEEMRERFPHLDWKVTAGNSSQITDGAAGLLLMSEERAERLGLRARARVVASAVCGDDPLLMLTGPIPATRRVLDRAGMTIGDIDAIEVNEAFASVPLAWLHEFDADPAAVNPRGGAIALGHPLGASGTRLLTTLLCQLDATGGQFGLQTMCEAGGMANAMIVERLG